MKSLDTVPGASVLVDSDYTIVEGNIRAEIVFRDDLEHIRGKELGRFEESGLFDAATLEAWKRDIDRVLGGNSDEVATEITFTPGSGDEYTYNHRLLGANDTDDEAVRCTFRSVGTRQRYEETITSLHVAPRDLVEADDIEAVLEKTAEAAHDVLGFPGTAVRRYDPETELLEFVSFGAVVNKIEDRPPFHVDDSPHGEAFREERTIIDEIDPTEDAYDREDFSQTMYIPIGDTGILSVGTVGKSFDETDVQFAEILAENATSAIRVVDTRNTLRQQRERLDQFASIVSHDLRNPLNSAELYRELAVDTGDLDYLEDVGEAHERMDEMIENLMTMARIDARDLETEPVDLPALARRAWGSVAAPEATVQVELSDGDTVRGNPELLRHVFENLFRNAVEHNSATVTVTVGELDDESGVYIEDDGTGIPADKHDQIFEHGRTTADEGNGFGLTIVENVVDVHGWDIEAVESTGGARFEIRTVSRPPR